MDFAARLSRPGELAWGIQNGMSARTGCQ